MFAFKQLRQLILLLCMLFLVGCNVSNEEAATHAKELFYSSFKQEQVVGETELEQVKVTIPKGVELVEESEYNLLFEKNGQPFLLFFNPLEPVDSNVNLQHDKEMEKDAFIFETVEESGKLGYIAISPDEKEKLRIIVGLGGAKITTIAKKSNVQESVQLAVDMLHSLTYLNK